MKTRNKEILKALRVAGAIVLVLALSGCILQPEGDRTGSVTLSFAASAVGASQEDGTDTENGDDAIGTSAAVFANSARIFLYGEDGRELRQFRGSTSLANGRGRIQLDGIPEGAGYRVVAVKYVHASNDDDAARLPIASGESARFSITGGRETTVRVSTRYILDDGTGEVDVPTDSDGAIAAVAAIYPEAFRGLDLVGAVRTDFSEGDDVYNVIAAATASRVLGTLNDEIPFSLLLNGLRFNATQPDAISGLGVLPVGPDEGFLPAIISDVGLYPLMIDASSSNSLLPDALQIAQASNTAGAVNLQDAVGFVFTPPEDEEEDEAVVWFYSRLGGLGGIAFSPGEDLNDPDDWFDSGDELEEFIDANENPIRAMATDGTNAAYVASSLGTFRLTKEFLEDNEEDEDDIDVAALIAGESTNGLTFFGVPFPGSTRPLRINQFGVVRADALGGTYNRVVVGTPRGALWFSGQVFEPNADGDIEKIDRLGNIVATEITLIRETSDQPVLDIAVAGKFVAVATQREVLVFEASTDGLTVWNRLPARSAVLGEPNRLFVYDEEGSPILYISGSEGLTVLELPKVE